MLRWESCNISNNCRGVRRRTIEVFTAETAWHHRLSCSLISALPMAARCTCIQPFVSKVGAGCDVWWTWWARSVRSACVGIGIGEREHSTYFLLHSAPLRRLQSVTTSPAFDNRVQPVTSSGPSAGCITVTCRYVTSSGPSASLSARAHMYMCAIGVSVEIPRAPWIC